MILDTSLVSVVPFPLSIPEVPIISHIVWICQPYEDPKLLNHVVSGLFMPKTWIPRMKLSSCVSLLVYSSWWCEVNHDLWQRFWYTWINKEVPPYLQLCQRATMIPKLRVPLVDSSVLLWLTVCYYESPIFKECLVMVSKAMQLLATLSLRILSSVELLSTETETSSISSVTLDVFRACHLKSCLQQSFHELTMR
jgi:hypothetical protein